MTVNGWTGLRRMAAAMLCLLLMTGCWSRRELNELLIVIGVGIDWSDGEYLVSFQVVNPGEISSQQKGGQRPPVTLYQGRGKTVFEAARSMTAEAPRKVYMGHLQLYIFSEELARRGVNDIIDNMLRDNELRLDFNLIVAKNTSAQTMMELYTPLEKLPSNNMYLSLQTSGKTWAPSAPVTLDEALAKLSADGDELALTGIELIGTPRMGRSRRNVEAYLPPSRFRYTGIAAFKDDRLVGWLNEKESKGYTDITNRLESSSIELACDEKKNYMGIEVTSAHTHLSVDMKGGKPTAAIHSNVEANIVDRPCTNVDLTDPATIERLEKRAERQLRSNEEAAVKKAQQFKTDILGFGSQLGKEHPQAWKKIKDKWNDVYFPELDVRYDIKLNIRKTGTTGNTTLKPTIGKGG